MNEVYKESTTLDLKRNVGSNGKAEKAGKSQMVRL